MSKCIIITTINPPSPQLLSYTSQPGWDLIVVGDSKTDDSWYRSLHCIYLGLTEQKEQFPSLFEKIPLRSYTRKMFGYLYAIQHNKSIIYDTDDDNKYTDDLDLFMSSKNSVTCDTPGFVNLYRLFTDEHIWPRGIPPNHTSVTEVPSVTPGAPALDVAVIQGLVNNDPDVDAFYRINVKNTPFTFEKDPGYDVILGKNSVCPFNTQNTFWFDPSTFYAMYLPVSVTFRYTDILRGFIALFQLWKQNKTIKFTLPTAIQDRNEHDLKKDYESEEPMYKTAEQVIQLLHENSDAGLKDVYRILCNHGIVQESEMAVLDEWLRLVQK